MDSDRPAAYENVRSQIGCCGIWCGSCAVGNGTMRELTIRLEEVLRSHGLKHWAPEDLDYAGLERALAVVRRVATCTGCRKGGGRDDCEMRICCGERGTNDCLACAEVRSCRHAEILETMRSGARAADLLVKEADVPDAPLLEEWERRARG